MVVFQKKTILCFVLFLFTNNNKIEEFIILFSTKTLFYNFLFSQDSVYVLASAIKEMMIRNETLTEAPKDCDDSGTIWESGN